MGIIYKVTCICHPEAGVRYVGQTRKTLQSRKQVHIWVSETESSKSYNTYFYNWIRKHGQENILFEIMETVEDWELDQREEYWIKRLKTEGYKLTNLRPGGVSVSGYKNPKQSENMKGEKNPMFGKDRRKEMAYARSFQKPMSAQNREKMSKRVKGEGNPTAKLTEEDVRYIRSLEYRYGLHAELGRRYGVSGSQIQNVRSGKTWKHVE